MQAGDVAMVFYRNAAHSNMMTSAFITTYIPTTTITFENNIMSCIRTRMFEDDDDDAMTPPNTLSAQFTKLPEETIAVLALAIRIY